MITLKIGIFSVTYDTYIIIWELTITKYEYTYKIHVYMSTSLQTLKDGESDWLYMLLLNQINQEHRTAKTGGIPFWQSSDHNQIILCGSNEHFLL